MTKHTVIYWDEIVRLFKPSIGLKLWVNGKAHFNENHLFSKRDIKFWIQQIKGTNNQHPILEELVLLGSFLQNHRVNMVLV